MFVLNKPEKCGLMNDCEYMKTRPYFILTASVAFITAKIAFILSS